MKNLSLKGIMRIVLLAVISVFIGLKLYAWNAKTLVGNGLAMPFGYGVTVVLSGSMEPELSVNDVVVIKECKSYSVGDIVVYQDGNSLVIHRIISLDGETAVTQGDANNVPDEPIKLSDIKGKKTAAVPYIGAVVRFLKSTAGFIVILAAAVVLFEMPYRAERKRINSEQEKIKEEIRRLKDGQ